VALVLAVAASVMVPLTVAPPVGAVIVTERGGGTFVTVTVAVPELLAPKLSLTVSVTTNVPAAEYVWETTAPEAVPKSPNAQLKLVRVAPSPAVEDEPLNVRVVPTLAD
jgi:hypothetical protein